MGYVSHLFPLYKEVISEERWKDWKSHWWQMISRKLCFINLTQEDSCICEFTVTVASCLRLHKMKPDEISVRKRECAHEVPTLAEELLALLNVCERGAIFFKNVTSGRSTTLQGRPHTQEYLGSTNQTCWDRKSKQVRVDIRDVGGGRI